MSASEKKARKAMDSDSDSGPLDRNPPQSPAKKQKTDGAAPQKNAEGEYVFELGRMRRISVKEFKGRVLVHIREYYLDRNSGDMRPGRKGIALSAEQWNRLKENVNEIDAAVRECA